MTKYEYRAVACPPPTRRELSQGADPLAETLTGAINELAEDGWDYLRTETVEVPVRRFLRTVRQPRCFLVFRREIRDVAPRAVVDPMAPIVRAHARRVKPAAKVEFIRSGARQIAAPANSDRAGPAAAAE